MVHASLRAVGTVAGGPDEVHLAIKDVITAEGSMLMYAGCADGVDDVGRGHLTPREESEILEKEPAFDPRVARSSRSNGALVEMFRTYPGSTVNDHVTRFVVWGRNAEYLIERQPWNYAYGRDSVLGRFTELNGKILLLGSDRDNVTYLHHAEHIADIPDRIVARYKVPVMERGQRIWREMEEYDTGGVAHASWPPNYFARLVNDYLSTTRNEGGRVGDAHAVLMPAKGLLDHALADMTARARAAET